MSINDIKKKAYDKIIKTKKYNGSFEEFSNLSNKISDEELKNIAGGSSSALKKFTSLILSLTPVVSSFAPGVNAIQNNNILSTVENKDKKTLKKKLKDNAGMLAVATGIPISIGIIALSAIVPTIISKCAKDAIFLDKITSAEEKKFKEFVDEKNQKKKYEDTVRLMTDVVNLFCKGDSVDNIYKKLKSDNTFSSEFFSDEINQKLDKNNVDKGDLGRFLIKILTRLYFWSKILNESSNVVKTEEIFRNILDVYEKMESSNIQLSLKEEEHKKAVRSTYADRLRLESINVPSESVIIKQHSQDDIDVKNFFIKESKFNSINESIAKINGIESFGDFNTIEKELKNIVKCYRKLYKNIVENSYLIYIKYDEEYIKKEKIKTNEYLKLLLEIDENIFSILKKIKEQIKENKESSGILNNYIESIYNIRKNYEQIVETIRKDFKEENSNNKKISKEEKQKEIINFYLDPIKKFQQNLKDITNISSEKCTDINSTLEEYMGKIKKIQNTMQKSFEYIDDIDDTVEIKKEYETVWDTFNYYAKNIMDIINKYKSNISIYMRIFANNETGKDLFEDINKTIENMTDTYKEKLNIKIKEDINNSYVQMHKKMAEFLSNYYKSNQNSFLIEFKNKPKVEEIDNNKWIKINSIEDENLRKYCELCGKIDEYLDKCSKKNTDALESDNIKDVYSSILVMKKNLFRSNKPCYITCFMADNNDIYVSKNFKDNYFKGDFKESVEEILKLQENFSKKIKNYDYKFNFLQTIKDIFNNIK